MKSEIMLRPKNIKFFYPTIIPLMMATKKYIAPDVATGQRQMIEFVAHEHSNMLEVIGTDKLDSAVALEIAYDRVREELYKIYGTPFTDYSKPRGSRSPE
jgi:hypothetical protein